MQTPLNASASSAGALLSSSTFDIPPFQREYSWQEDEIAEFWRDLSTNIDSQSYFLGLVILTDEEKRKHVVDGQQRLVTMTLLATALYYEAIKHGRQALADRIQADFLRSIDYTSDEVNPRIRLTDNNDNETLQAILSTGEVEEDGSTADSVSRRMAVSFKYLQEMLRDDLKPDPFKRLGKWTEFLAQRVYFAVFVHPDPASAYQVYEVINTRGKALTTADLLKNYVLSQTASGKREERYQQWQSISSQFSDATTNSFVQYIRHAITVGSGHVLPRDLYKFLAQRATYSDRRPPTCDALMKILEKHLPLYLQMIDPTLPGPAEGEMLRVFSALNALGVIAVRPILLAIFNTPNALEGMKYVLRLVVRRIVVGNLGTGNVERRFGEAAKSVNDNDQWNVLLKDLEDLSPTREEFVEQLRKRSFNKSVLTFLRQSIVEQRITPDPIGVLHFIWPRQLLLWNGRSHEEIAVWAATIGNTFLSTLDRRPKTVTDWNAFKQQMFPTAIPNEWVKWLSGINDWNATGIEKTGKELAGTAGNVWY